MNPASRAHLRAQLAAKARESAAEARRLAAECEAARTLRRDLDIVWILPAFGAAIGLVALAVGHVPNLLHPAGMLLAMLLGLGLRMAWKAYGAWRKPVDPVAALNAFDAQVGGRGRLVAAHEFLAAGAEGSFETATIEDAAARLDGHLGERLTLEARGPLFDDKAGPHLVAAAVLLLLHTLLFLHFEREVPNAGREDVAALDGGAPAPDEVRAAPTGDAGADGDPAPRPNDVQDPRERPAPEPKEAQPGAKLPDSMLPSAGESGEGKSADAETQSTPSESRGAPSGQQPAPPKERAPQLDSKKEQEKKPSADDARRESKPEEEQGGASAGRGSAKGSNRNTTTSKWTGKDQVTTPDDQEIEEDEDTEDESEEQKNRGGMQPNLRDRRPPVSRDLRIGFGNQPSPDANGRGGPSEPKKSRGTASLVLGVPIPDRVKGQPNPGPTRITQERIEPTPEDAPDRPTEPRGERTLPLDPLTRPAPPEPTTQLTPWQRQLITRYLGARRQAQP